jgi:hypothetical protein
MPVAMSGIVQFAELLLANPALLAVIAFLNAPELFADRRCEAERDFVRQAELEREIAIAEAAMAARRRGETFVPPRDYDR